MVKRSTIWIFCVEPLESRYTGEWHRHVPALLKEKVGDEYNIVQIDGVQNNTETTPGAFLNFSDTNYWKSSQLCNFLEKHNNGETTPDDQFLFTDAWNPTIIQIKYMNDLLGFNWKLHGLWHAGSYDLQDCLGRIVGNKPWVRNAEKSFFDCYDHNYFATEFHVEMFMVELLNNGSKLENPWFEDDWAERYDSGKIVRTGWPMEYMVDTLKPYIDTPKEDIIIFPHRLAPEKQPEIFRDLAKSLPEYKFVVCQDNKLTKQEYHKLLAKSKLMWSANLQETLGISPYEGALLGVFPLLPNRLSYTEMYDDAYLYPSEWTLTYEDYLKNKAKIIEDIKDIMYNYDYYASDVKNRLAKNLTKDYFSATNLVNKLLGN